MADRKKPNPEPIRCRVTVKHEFTNEEWKSKTDILTREMKQCELKEEAIKAQAATAKAELKNMKATVNDLANDLRNGYAMVEVDAKCEFNRKKGSKKFYHFAPGKPHNGDFIKEEPMTEDDFQALPIDGDQAGAPAAGPGPNPEQPAEKPAVYQATVEQAWPTEPEPDAAEA